MSQNLTRSVVISRSCLGKKFSIQGCEVPRVFSTRSKDIEKPEQTTISASSRNGRRELSVKELLSAKSYSEMPSVRMIPFIGSSWAYLPIIGKYSTNKLHLADIEKNRVYGDVVRERFGKFEIVSSFTPDTMKVLSENEGIYPARSDFSCLKVYRENRKEWYDSDGFLVAQGKEWKAKREILHKYLAHPYLNIYLNPLDDIAYDFVQLISWELDGKKEVPDVIVHLRKWALECITRITLNTRLGCLRPYLDEKSDIMKLLNAVQTQLDCMYKLEASSGNFQLWKYISTPTWLKFKKAADVFTSLSHTYISCAESSLNEVSGEITPSFLRILLDQGASMSSAMVTVGDIILSGLDTAAHTAAFFLYNLAKNPDKQDLVYEEVSRVLPEDGTLTPQSYEQLVYIKSCLKESMRLTPTVRGNVRVLDRAVVVNGYVVPAGTAILCVHQVIHRNEEYFKHADCFLPERWNGKDATKLNEFAYQPFGHGLSSCLGKNLAEMEIVTLVAKIVREYTVEYHHEEVGMFTRLINVPDRPLRMKFLRR